MARNGTCSCFSSRNYKELAFADGALIEQDAGQSRGTFRGPDCRLSDDHDAEFATHSNLDANHRHRAGSARTEHVQLGSAASFLPLLRCVNAADQRDG